jgi:hypothetical protein
LTAAGSAAIAAESQAEERMRRRERQQQALGRASALVDVDSLLTDAAWR